MSWNSKYPREWEAVKMQPLEIENEAYYIFEKLNDCVLRIEYPADKDELYKDVDNAIDLIYEHGKLEHMMNSIFSRIEVDYKDKQGRKLYLDEAISILGNLDFMCNSIQAAIENQHLLKNLESESLARNLEKIYEDIFSQKKVLLEEVDKALLVEIDE